MTETCKDRIEEQWRSTQADIGAMLLGEDWDTYKEANGYDGDGHEAFSEYGLCFDYIAPVEGDQGYYRFQMSWGGPSDELRFFGTREGQVHVIEYWFMDWFDGASLRVTDDKHAQAVGEWFAGCEAFESAWNEANQ